MIEAQLRAPRRWADYEDESSSVATGDCEMTPRTDISPMSPIAKESPDLSEYASMKITEASLAAANNEYNERDAFAMDDYQDDLDTSRSMNIDSVPPSPSQGSAGHHHGRCKPCAFYHTKGCQADKACSFCHLCPPNEKQRRKRHKKQIVGAIARGEVDIKDLRDGKGRSFKGGHSRQSSATSCTSTSTWSHLGSPIGGGKGGHSRQPSEAAASTGKCGHSRQPSEAFDAASTGAPSASDYQDVVSVGDSRESTASDRQAEMETQSPGRAPMGTPVSIGGPQNMRGFQRISPGWNAQYMPAGMGYEQAFMYQHHVLQPMPAQYGYSPMQAGLRYYVTPQQVQWHPAHQVNAPLAATQAVKEKEKIPMVSPNTDYATYAFKKPVGSEDGVIYEAPTYDLKAVKKEQKSFKYAKYSFQESVPLDGMIYEAPRFL